MKSASDGASASGSGATTTEGSMASIVGRDRGDGRARRGYGGRRQERSRGRGGGGAPRSRPTHFLALQLPDAALHSAIAEVQKTLVERDSSLAQCAVSPAKTHLTLLVFDGSTEDRLSAARDALEAVSASVSATVRRLPRVNIHGLATFGDKVLYAAVQEPTEDMTLLRTLRSAAVDAFAERGLVDPAEARRSWTPHVTLLKTSQAQRPRRGEPAIKIRPEVYAGLEDMAFGEHATPELSICPMQTTDVDGFYVRIATAALYSEEARDTPVE